MDGSNIENPKPKKKKSEVRQRQKQTKVRWLDNEFNKAAANARTAGLSLGAYIRASTTGDAGDRAQGEGPVDANLLRKVIAELARYGNNWNQVAYKLNINEAPWKLHDEIRQELANLREVIALNLEALGKKPHHA